MNFARLKEHTTWGSWVPDHHGSFSFQQVCDKAVSLDSEAMVKLASAMPAGSLVATTFGPNEAFVCPGGWLVAETTQATSTRGFRRTLLQQDNEWLQHQLKHEAPNVLMTAVADAIEKVNAQRGRAAPAAVGGQAASAAKEAATAEEAAAAEEATAASQSAGE
eukprot:6242951-Lingulodinium_polyedra.AAC.1